MPIEQHLLYGGNLLLKFNPEKHLYTVDDQPVDGVTSILSVIAKPALISWAANMAAEEIGKYLVPGKGLDEIQIKELVTSAKNAHRKKKDKSADIGTLVHDWIETYIKTGKKNEVVNKEVQAGIDAFIEWREKTKAEFLHSEGRVYSVAHAYAGTFDFICEINGKKYIGDIKTSSAVYPEMFLQTAAYDLARTEEHPGEKYDGHIIVNCAKTGELKVVEADREDIERNKETFIHVLALYRWTKSKK